MRRYYLIDSKLDLQTSFNQSETAENYLHIAEFFDKYPNTDFLRFENYLVSKTSLFVAPKEIGTENIKKTLSLLKASLPSIINIFEHPLIHLRENSEVLPIEAVTKIDEETLRHAMTHSELWDGKTLSQLKPSRLLTKKSIDNYSIYENLIFHKTIDKVIAFLNKSICLLEAVMFSSRRIEFNILERYEHSEYFFALGKLHSGYVRDFDKAIVDYPQMYRELCDIRNIICSHLHYRVYSETNIKNKKLPLRQTNILSMHKDYHNVFLLAKHFRTISYTSSAQVENDISLFGENYANFCLLLTFFSLIHFNFTTDENTNVCLSAPDVTFTFKKWSISLATQDKDEKKIIVLKTVYNEQNEYTVYLVPCIEYDIFEGNTNTDGVNKEIIFFSPYKNKNLNDIVCVNITDIDSFRRIQQIILKCMIYSAMSNGLEECPFCKSNAISGNKKDEFVCTHCKTSITKEYCNKEHKKFYSSTIKPYKPDSALLYDGADISYIYHYRNITAMTKNGETICPFCQKVHR